MEHRPGESLTEFEKENMYRQIVEYSFQTTVIHSDHKVLYINQAGADFLKGSKSEIIGANIVEVFTEEYREYIIERIRRGTEENLAGEMVETIVHRLDGTVCDVELYCHPVIYGNKKAIQSILLDITAQKTAERELKRVMNEVGTPVVPVSEGVAVLPLIGEIDEDRARQLLEVMPQKVIGKNLNYLIVDFSGIYNIDEVVIEFLFKINSVMKLLGISPICTGIRPEMAQKAVETHKDLTSIVTISDVQQALTKLADLNKTQL